jgi:hypothetical protein
VQYDVSPKSILSTKKHSNSRPKEEELIKERTGGFSWVDFVLSLMGGQSGVELVIPDTLVISAKLATPVLLTNWMKDAYHQELQIK